MKHIPPEPMDRTTEGAASKDCLDSNWNAGQSDAVNRFFDAASATWSDYYEGHADTLSHLDLTVRLHVATTMLQEACKEARDPIALLDAGCGTGEGTSQLSGMQLKAFAVDLSAAMVGKAVRRYTYLEGCAANAVQLPFVDNVFDIILSLGTLEYISPCDLAVKEFRRVLKPGGTLICSIPNRASWFRRLDLVERKLTRPLRRMRARLRGVGVEAAGLIQTFQHQSWTLSEVERLLGGCNFELAAAKLITYGWLLPIAESWRANLALCRWMNIYCRDKEWLARRLACTTVLCARAV